MLFDLKIREQVYVPVPGINRVILLQALESESVQQVDI